MTYLPLRVRIKLIIKKLVPTFLFASILKVWRKTFAHMFSDMDVVGKYTKIFLEQNGHKVVGGPFAGLSYVEEAAGSSYLIKLIGVYEEILHAPIKKVMAGNYTSIIDIGCAEGYYLVGLGRALPQAKLVGCDIDPKALELTKKLYTINNLTNPLSLVDNCTPETLTAHIDDNTFLMCDAEGFEAEILDPEKTPALARVKTIIVELHDFVVPGIKEIITKRFAPTHGIQTIVFKNGDPTSYPFLMSIKNQKEVYSLLRERGEQEQEWLVMERK